MQLSPLIFTQKTVDWGKWVFGYFNLSRRERIGVLFLAFLILFTFFLPRFLGRKGAGTSVPDTAWVAKLRELELKQEKKEKVRKRDTEEEPLYAYNQDLKPYSRTPYARTDSTRHGTYPDRNESRNHYSPYTPRYSPVDINLGDTTAFIALPGIGNKLASRIINFREKLGGFYSFNQVSEVYGLADSIFQKIKPYLQLNDATVKKININTATIDELKAHPYIKYNIAKAIIAYRNEHGSFLKTEDLKNIMLINDELYLRILPYASIEE